MEYLTHFAFFLLRNYVIYNIILKLIVLKLFNNPMAIIEYRHHISKKRFNTLMLKIMFLIFIIL